jgi:ERCC4-type nuclease
MGIKAILLDAREPTWIQQLTFGGAAVSITMLDAGDLLIACDDDSLLAIERKTPGDLLNTLREERLFPQIAKLREVTPFAYLVICGDLRPGPSGQAWADGKATGWNWASVSGALLSVQELGVHIIQCSGDNDYDQTVIRLANRDRQTIKTKPARDITVIGEAEQLLTALPGIGAEKAEALLKYCGSAAWALNYLTDLDFEGSVPGIGEGIKRKVRRALGLEEWAEVCVITRDTHQKAENIQKENVA